MLSRVIGQRIMWVDASVLVGCMGCVVSGCATSQQRTWPLGLVTLASEAASKGGCAYLWSGDGCCNEQAAPKGAPHIHAHHPTWPAGKGLLTHPDAEVRLHPVMMLCLQGHSLSLTGVAFSPDGALIASSSWDDSVRVWEVASGKRRATLKVEFSSPT